MALRSTVISVQIDLALSINPRSIHDPIPPWSNDPRNRCPSTPSTTCTFNHPQHRFTSPKKNKQSITMSPQLTAKVPHLYPTLITKKALSWQLTWTIILWRAWEKTTRRRRELKSRIQWLISIRWKMYRRYHWRYLILVSQTNSLRIINSSVWNINC